MELLTIYFTSKQARYLKSDSKLIRACLKILENLDGKKNYFLTSDQLSLFQLYEKTIGSQLLRCFITLVEE